MCRFAWIEPNIPQIYQRIFIKEQGFYLLIFLKIVTHNPQD